MIILVLTIDFLSFHDISQEIASIYFQCSSFFIIEWLFISPPTPLIGEQSKKMDPKYPEGGHCQSVFCPQGVFNIPCLKLIQWRQQHHLMWSATHKVLCCLHVTFTELHKYLGLELVLGRQCQSFIKFIQCPVADIVLYSTGYSIFQALSLCRCQGHSMNH